MKRRNFIKTSAVFAAPTIVPSSVLFAQGDKPTPNNRITLGLVGCGGQGTGDMKNIMNASEIQTVGVCDPEQKHADRAKKHVDGKYGNKDCKTYDDYRELCSRKDVDAIIVGTPDHWHALATLNALRNGKDVYCEKPITHLFAEGQMVYKEAAKQKAIFQVGSQQRSDTRFRVAAEAVLNGLLGKVKHVEVGLPTGKGTNEEGKVAQEIPAGLDYDMWCGPSKMLPFNPKRLHWNWRWCLDYGGGQMMDWIGHHNDIAHWGLDMDKSGPTKVEAKGFRYPMKGMWDNPIDYEVVSTYANGTTISISNKNKMGTKWIGENGSWVYVKRGKIEASTKEWIVEKMDRGPVKAYKVKGGHHRNWVDGILTRTECICPAETGHRSATPGHIGYVSDKLGRAIKWDPKAEKVIGDDEAQKLLMALPYRGEWAKELKG
jgi:predicted dehydrogenase